MHNSCNTTRTSPWIAFGAEREEGIMWAWRILVIVGASWMSSVGGTTIGGIKAAVTGSIFELEGGERTCRKALVHAFIFLVLTAVNNGVEMDCLSGPGTGQNSWASS
jgi:hypothetical protein